MLGLEGGVTSVPASPEPPVPTSEVPEVGGLQTPMLLQV
jgi:hypothetical protein